MTLIEGVQFIGGLGRSLLKCYHFTLRREGLRVERVLHLPVVLVASALRRELTPIGAVTKCLPLFLSHVLRDQIIHDKVVCDILKELKGKVTFHSWPPSLVLL